MSRITSLLLLALFAFACSPPAKKSEHRLPLPSASASPYLIEAPELLRIFERPDIKVLDFRKEGLYELGHIPGAMAIGRRDIEDTTYSYGGMMASPTQLSDRFRSMGIDRADTIIIYDDNGLCNAARLWWILQNYDFDQVRMLHGGLPAWSETGGSLNEQIPTYSDGSFSLNSHPSMKYHLSQQEMQAAITADMLILDTRSREEFLGQTQKKGAARAGRIPNSMHIDWANAIDYHGAQLIRSSEELKTIYQNLGSDMTIPIIVYCHSGVRSAHTTFILTQLLGYTDVRNYDGSWTEWSQDEQLPIVQDSLEVLAL